MKDPKNPIDGIPDDELPDDMSMDGENSPDDPSNNPGDNPNFGIPAAVFIGGPGMPLNLLPKIFGGAIGIPVRRRYEEYAIMGGTWLLRIVDVIESFDKKSATYYIEIFPNFRARNRNKEVDVLDVYELIIRTQFLNFVIGNLGGYHVYDNSQVKCVVHEDQQTGFVGLKIIVPTISSEIPRWIMDASPDFQIRSATSIDDVDGIKVNRYERRSRHTSLPMIIYDQVLTLTSATRIDFDSAPFDIGSVYLSFVAPLINDALSEFYPVTGTVINYAVMNCSRLHTIFDIAVEKNTFKLRLVCTPGLIGVESGEIYGFEYLGNLEYRLSSNPVARGTGVPKSNLTTAINGSFSQFIRSDLTQFFNMSIDSIGTRFTENGVDVVQRADGILFNCGLQLRGGEPWLAGDSKVINCTLATSKHCSDVVSGYWIPDNGPFKIMDASGGKFTIYGVINLNVLELAKMNIRTIDGLVEYLVKNDNVDEVLHFPQTPKKTLFRNDLKNYELCQLAVDDHTFRALVVNTGGE